MAAPLIEDICNKVFKTQGFWETVSAATVSGVTTITCTRTGRTAGTITIPPPPGLTAQSQYISEPELAALAIAYGRIFETTQAG
jgi:hypothetical protein